VVGGPFVGFVCQRWSPRIGLGFAGCMTTAVALAVAAGSAARRRARADLLLRAPVASEALASD
jgi:hypothetical protein